MTRPDKFTSPKQQEERAELFISKLNHAIEKDLRIAKTSFEREQEIEQTILTESGELPSQDHIASIFLDTNFRSQLYNHTLSALSFDLELSTIQEFIGSDKPIRTGISRQTAVDQLTYFFERMEDISPFQDAQRGKDFYDRVANSSLPLAMEDREFLNEAFAKPESTEDIMTALFLGVAAITTPNIWNAKPNTQKVALKFYRYADSINLVAAQYFHPLVMGIFDKRFQKSTPDALQDVFSEGDMRPLIMACNFAISTNILPQHFAQLMHDDLFPGLTSSTKDVLIAYYNDKFAKVLSQLIKEPDDLGFSPYRHALDSAENGSGIAYFRSLVETHQPEDPTDTSNIDWLATNFSRLRSNLRNTLLTIGKDTNVAAIDVAAYRKNFVDLVVVAEDERAYVLHIDSKGFIVGLPADLQEKGTLYVNHLLDNTRKHFESIWQRRRTKLTTNLIPETTGLTQPPLQQPHINTRITREQRKAKYAETKNKEELKRKALRAAGLLPPLSSEEEQATAVKKPIRRENGKIFHISLARTDVFNEQLANLPTQMQELVEGILEKIASNADYVRKHLKPLKERDPKYKELNAYSVRAGIGYRIKFVQTGSGEMAIASIDPRSKAYEDLARDYKAAQAAN